MSLLASDLWAASGHVGPVVLRSNHSIEQMPTRLRRLVPAHVKRYLLVVTSDDVEEEDNNDKIR